MMDSREYSYEDRVWMVSFADMMESFELTLRNRIADKDAIEEILDTVTDAAVNNLGDV
jgi:ACT domain-containing protein